MPHKNKEDKLERQRDRRREQRNEAPANKGGEAPLKNEAPVEAPGRLFSKFLSEEEDLKVEARVREALATMSGARLACFKELGNTFKPNKVRDPSLVVPEGNPVQGI